MDETTELERLSNLVAAIIGPPFDWLPIPGGPVVLEDASQWGGTTGGECQVAGFCIARYPVTNAQYQAFCDDPGGFQNAQWWEFSPQARQWRRDHPRPKPTAFSGSLLPRTRVSWFENMAFCAWLSEQCRARRPQTSLGTIRLPSEAEWQRAAVGDSGWIYPWGNEIDPSRGNYRKQIGQPTPVDRYPEGKSPYGVMDMIGNVWERCRTAWGKEADDVTGYTYRVMRGGAWNVSEPHYLRAVDRYGHPPRGQLNDAGFRIAAGY